MATLGLLKKETGLESVVKIGELHQAKYLLLAGTHMFCSYKYFSFKYRLPELVNLAFYTVFVQTCKNINYLLHQESWKFL